MSSMIAMPDISLGIPTCFRGDEPMLPSSLSSAVALLRCTRAAFWRSPERRGRRIQLPPWPGESTPRRIVSATIALRGEERVRSRGPDHSRHRSAGYHLWKIRSFLLIGLAARDLLAERSCWLERGCRVSGLGGQPGDSLWREDYGKCLPRIAARGFFSWGFEPLVCVRQSVGS